jgi:uncharacterized protein YndB with AHSA1/START domain
MSIEITRKVDAPPERVFRALTDADELGRWFASRADSDPRTGGEYVLRFEFEDESRNHTYSGRYEDVTPNERVRYPWNGRFGETTVEFVLTPSGAGTELTLVHSGWNEYAAESKAMHEQGWSFFLDNLERHLMGGEDERGPAMQQKTATSGAATAGGP